MVAFTFALYQYELMFNDKCVKLLKEHEQDIKNGKPIIVSVPATMMKDDKYGFYGVFVNGIGEWLKSDHTLGNEVNDPIMIIPIFMQEIGTNALLDKQFASTKPTSTGGRRHGSKRRNKRANTRARRMRKTNKRLSYF